MTDNEIIRKCAELMGWKYDVTTHPGHLFWMLEEDGEMGIRAYGDWNPLNNPADWMMLVEFARGKGWSWEIEYPAGQPYCVRFTRDAVASDWFISNEPGRAVCLAFIAAMEEKGQ